jgi:osmotically inducible lipoprotein OsmB
MTRVGKIAAVAVLIVSTGATAANADCQSRRTIGTVGGAVGGGLIGSAITHGGLVGTLGGAAAGGFVGHRIAGSGCHRVAYRHRHYYTDRYGHRHYYYRTARY